MKWYSTATLLFALVLNTARCGLELVADPVPPAPVLTSPAALKTNKAGRVKFEVQTNCSNVVYLVDDNAGDFMREFTPSTQFSYRFAADAPGTYKVVFVAAKGDVPLVSQTVITYDDPSPAPVPGPVPPGPPNPPPSPPAVFSKLFLVVIEDTAAAKAGRGAFYSNDALLARIRSKGWALRVESKDVLSPLGKTPDDLVPYVAAAKGKEPYLFIVTEKGKPLYEGALPGTVADLLTLLTKLGG